MKKKSMRRILFSVSALSLIFVLFSSAKKEAETDKKETALFNVNLKDKKVEAPSKSIRDNLRFKFISVTTDQPVYWPNEDVFLKALFPASPSKEIQISLQKKDASPRNLGKFKLNSAGMLVETVMSGKTKKLEPGEYSVNVKTADGKLTGSAAFSVVEGALGALSFAYEFEQITDAKNLGKVKGGWFFGNAEGVGKRWGNGLNIKNELRDLNQPYNGKATLQTRCYLPGCDGIEAGPPVETVIKDGQIEAALDVGGHSGPFGIEVVTPKGSVSYLFAKSGHVERQTIPVSGHMVNSFSATMAPYENTTPVPGRDIFIVKESENKEDSIELKSPIADASQEVELIVNKKLSNPKIIVVTPISDDEFNTAEIKLPKDIEKGKSIKIKCASPYSLIAAAGFDGENYYEGWAIAFTASPIDCTIKSPDSGSPLQHLNIEINTADKLSGNPVSVYGILEVFDNRVQSKSAKEPLVSAVGDSIRDYANYLVSWRDLTGINQELDEEAEKDYAPATLGQPSTAPLKKLSAVRSGAKQFKSESSAEVSENANNAEEQETIREGERKVVYCGIIKTDGSGTAHADIQLPPQTGRCKIRFTIVNKYDYFEKIKDIDVIKKSFLEVSLMPLIIPGAKVTARAVVINSLKDNIKLRISGAGLDKDIVYEIKPGMENIDFEVTGRKYGKLFLTLENSSGKILDKREIEIRNISSYPITFSDIRISDGSTIIIDKGGRAAVYSSPGRLLDGMVMNMVTTMYSWFGHSEALSSAAAIRAGLLKAIDAKIIDDEGMRGTLKSDLVKTVRDLNEAFYNPDTRLFRPYPGIDENALWSAWTVRNLKVMVKYLKDSPALKEELAGTIALAEAMTVQTAGELKKRKISIMEEALYNSENSDEVIPVEIDGKVIYKAATDPAVAEWYVKKMAPLLDVEGSKNMKDINLKFIKAYDTYRFLRSFERTGALYYLLLNAKALYLKGDKNFGPLFNKIAGGVIMIQEPGLIQGPALLGGVYSSPLTVMSFLDLLMTMAVDKKFTKTEAVVNGKKTALTGSPLLIDAKDGSIELRSSEFTVVRIDREKEIDMADYIQEKPFFNAKIDDDHITMGSETILTIELDKDKDPSEYYALIAVPSVLSVRQTEDLLSDYKGQLIYGQRSSGSEKIQLLTVPFRGSGKMVLNLEAAQKGESEGIIMVRHINNPEIIVSIRINKVVVK